MKACVFIQTNHKQITGALVAQHALRRYSRNNDKFDVQIIDSRDYPFFAEHEGQEYLRDGVKRVWLNDDEVELTSFEYKVLNYLVMNPDKVVTKSELSEHIYEEDADRDSNVIEVFVGRLRRKLDPDGSLKPIETLRGRGYRLNLPA